MGTQPQTNEQPQGVPFAVRCDRCKAHFRVVPQDRATPGGGMVHFFACPSCGHEYVMARITAHGIELRNRLTAIRRSLAVTHGERHARLQRQAEQIRWELQAEVTGAEA